jgi:hypothetical protein
MLVLAARNGLDLFLAIGKPILMDFLVFHGIFPEELRCATLRRHAVSV